jgi:hypothetical protein
MPFVKRGNVEVVGVIPDHKINQDEEELRRRLKEAQEKEYQKQQIKKNSER